MKLLSTIAISALLLVPAAALAQDSRHKERSDDTGDGARMICRTSGVTGSRVKSGRICMTADEWADARRNSRNIVEQNQQRRPSQDIN